MPTRSEVPKVSPLARASEADPQITERFELYITGREYAGIEIAEALPSRLAYTRTTF